MIFQDRFARFGLAPRAMILVTVALLPLGLIALWQTDRIMKGEREAASRVLLVVTEKAAARERQIIERAIGTAAALGNTAQSLSDQPQLCAQTMRNFERGSAFYSFVGFVGADGYTGCGSVLRTAVSDNDSLVMLMDSERPGLYVKRNPEMPEDSVLVVATPVFQNGTYAGHLRLHIPHVGFEPTADNLDGERPLGLVTFNENGEILTSERILKRARSLLPDGVILTDLISNDPYTFTAQSTLGEERVYAVVPLVDGNAYALGTWDIDTSLLQSDAPYWRTIILAVLMWSASLLVIFLIMQLLVIRGIQRLRGQLRDFRDDRFLPIGDITARGELYELEAEFREMSGMILRDEAQLENAVHEKNVLLKEVHHRVKNNLQLINSIINMILRGARSDETKLVVRRLQDRIMALASVHRSIYQAQSMDRVDAAEIVREIVNQGVAIGLPRDSSVEVDVDLSPVALYPDQAMPLSMFVSEAVTNALKYVGSDTPRITVSLKNGAIGASDGDTHVTLIVANTTDAAIDDVEGTGLGSRLLRAFASQLEGELTTSDADGTFTLQLVFGVSQFEPEDEDMAQAAE